MILGQHELIRQRRYLLLWLFIIRKLFPIFLPVLPSRTRHLEDGRSNLSSTDLGLRDDRRSRGDI